MFLRGSGALPLPLYGFVEGSKGGMVNWVVRDGPAEYAGMWTQRQRQSGRAAAVTVRLAANPDCIGRAMIVVDLGEVLLGC